MSLPMRHRRPEVLTAPVMRGLCEVSGKRRWSSRAEARVQLRELKARGKRGTGLTTYRCARACGDWHVGHR